MSSDLNSRSSELICWLTADWVTPLICAALVKLSVSARSQNTFKLSICISWIKPQINLFVNTQICDFDLLQFGQQLRAGERFLQIGRRRFFLKSSRDGHKCRWQKFLHRELADFFQIITVRNEHLRVRRVFRQKLSA